MRREHGIRAFNRRQRTHPALPLRLFAQLRGHVLAPWQRTKLGGRAWRQTCAPWLYRVGNVENVARHADAHMLRLQERCANGVEVFDDLRGIVLQRIDHVGYALRLTQDRVGLTRRVCVGVEHRARQRPSHHTSIALLFRKGLGELGCCYTNALRSEFAAPQQVVYPRYDLGVVRCRRFELNRHRFRKARADTDGSIVLEHILIELLDHVFVREPFPILAPNRQREDHGQV